MTTYDIYIDESSQTKHPFILLGGLIVRTNLAPALDAMLDIAGAYYRVSRESKWGKVSAKHLPYYTALVDTFFRSPDYLHPCDFHSLAIERGRQDHARFSEGDKEMGFNKEVYQLIMKFARLYPNGIYHVHLDYRNSTQSNEETRRILNNGMRSSLGRYDAPVRRLHMRKSHDVLALQLVDVLLGGVAYHLNGHHLKPNSSLPKRKLSGHILEEAGIRDVKRSTRMSGKFTLWHRELQ